MGLFSGKWTLVDMYVQGWHDRHAGATANVLGGLSGDDGRSSYSLVADALADAVGFDGKILDLACGDGPLLAQLARDREAFGVDRNLTELRLGRRRSRVGGRVVQADASCLPLASASLGGVGCHFALMLTRPLEVVLTELARVLTDGGFLVAALPGMEAEPVVEVFRRVWSEVVGIYPVEIPDIQDVRALDDTALRVLLRDAGFTLTEWEHHVVGASVPVERVVSSMLLTYLPDLLPEEGRAMLGERLRVGLEQLSSGPDGGVRFEQGVELLIARRRSS